MQTSFADTAEAHLEVHSLHLWRGDKHLLRGVSFKVSPGELLQVVGPNGVGKTTLLRCVAGLLPAESGDIHWRSRPLSQVRSDFDQQLAYLAHSNALKPDLTALENLHYSISVRRQVERSEISSVLDRLQVGQCADLPARALSAGQKRRVSLARILLMQAPLWILDEPITNLDTAGIALFERCMGEHLDGGGMIITAAHQWLLSGQSRARSLELQA